MHCSLNKNELELEWLMFDFDNTLVDFHKASLLAFGQTFEDFNLKLQPEYYSIYEKINGKIWNDFEQKLITTVDIRKSRFKLLFERLNIESVDGFEFNAKYLSNLVKHTTVRPEVINMLTKLKAHFKMSIITNGLKEVQRPRLDKCLMTHLFDSIIVSDEIGAAKPDLAFFDVAIKSIPNTIKKDKILVIGDSLKSDIAGGINYGLKTCLIDPYDSFLLVNADIVVQDVLELEQLLLDVYQPIDCGFYDYLEIYCMRKTTVKIDFTEISNQASVITKIENLFSKNKVEFAKLANGTTIRLDIIRELSPISDREQYI